ncbi:5-oxoprolinase subunit PxpB [Shewanella sp. UCD-KL12]|uniref:5-oxoprolinase subunit PxpB n=1 Tax=Shewanella sp. UCD-KL12 TaxID=1917163 RepID=UPI0009703FE1|nr:5-oxoprolinase subunit PxpB [Shewanella sp. UCD-KL12]
MNQTQKPKLFRLGEKALVLDCTSLTGAESELTIQSKIWCLSARCHESDDFEDIVPGNNNLTLFLKSNKQVPFWYNQLLQLWHKTSIQHKPGTLIKIPVIYGGEYGPDLMNVAEHNQIQPEEVIAIHSSIQYQVLFLGFQPGFPYLSGLDKRLFTPRLATPRLSIPAGSVGIGGEQTGIYPAQSPGGWQLIGRSFTPLFDQTQAQPSLLSPGDTVQFIPAESLDEIEDKYSGLNL